MHIPPLLIATGLTYGGTIPFWKPAAAIREFGLSEGFAQSQPAQQSFVIGGARVSIIGVAMWIFYLQGKLPEVDTMMTLMAYMGAVDGYVCWKEGVARTGAFRAAVGFILGAWGWFGLTTRATRGS